MEIRERLKQVRQALELTQQKFAERIAISTSYLAAMETGDKQLNERTIRLISMEFNVSEHWLRTGDGEMYNETENIAVVKITSLFKSLTPKFQECAFKQMEALAEVEKVES